MLTESGLAIPLSLKRSIGAHMNFRLFISITTLTLLSACAGPLVSLNEPAKKQLDSIDHLLFVPQHKIYVSIHRTSGGGGILGALIGAGIDNYRLSRDEKRAAPLIEALKGYDFRSVMLDAIRSEINDSENLKHRIRTQVVEPVHSKEYKQEFFDNANSSAVLFTLVRYKLESGDLVITMTAELYPKKEALYRFRDDPDDKNPLYIGNIIYRKKFSYKKAVVTDVASKFTKGASILAGQLINDLEK